MRKKSTVDIDKKIGDRLRELRLISGFSQQDLGEKIGITFQQIQKYEKGTNRVSSSTLFEISMIFGVPVTYFFHNIGNPQFSGTTIKLTPQIVRLIKDFESLSNERKKRLLHFLRLIKKSNLIELNQVNIISDF